jgi:Methyltransferase domain
MVNINNNSNTESQNLENLPKKFPDGHFYSPLVNIDEVKQGENRIWSERPELLGIDFNSASHRFLLSEVFPSYISDYDYPLAAHSEANYFNDNSQFSWLDSRTLFVILRHLRPKRMIEIGSGFSSLLTADVNRRFLNSQLEFTCIEPYPRNFLLTGIAGISHLIQSKVQDVPLSSVTNLQSGDILFIDSSHVCKTGSDVNHIYFEILPRLPVGVFIHIHDIFLPYEYPKHWVIDDCRSWNEQYLVRALLMYTQAFEVIFGCNFAFHKYPELVSKVLNGDLYGGGSLWLRKIAN